VNADLIAVARWFLLTAFFCLTAHLFAALQKTIVPRTRPNVILVTIDTLRADHVGCYGAANVKTPTMDSLAKDGLLFENAFSQVPLTWPSHAAILTGTYPFQNGVQDLTGHPLCAAVSFRCAGI
jgi:arylsulfatase A-like enzyme